MRRNLLILLLLLGGVCHGRPAWAAETTMTFSDASYTTMARIRGRGPITARTPADFERFLAAYKGRAVEGVYLDSEGGSLGAGILLGRAIRRRGLNTVVDNTDHCLSACAYAFLGGRERILFPERDKDEKEVPGQTRLGFHRFGYDTLPGQIPRELVGALSDRISGDVQSVASMLADYVTEMGVSTEIISLASEYKGRQFLLLDPARLVKLRIVTDPEADAADFVLLPSGSSLTAVWRHIDDLVTFACVSRGRHVNSPAIIFSAPIGSADQVPPSFGDDAPRLSEILKAPALPWRTRDLEHKHFHAHDWIKNRYWNPVFSGLSIFIYGQPDDPLSFETPGSIDFSADAKYFHAIAYLDTPTMRRIIGLNRFAAYMTEGAMPNWSLNFINTPIEREILATALRPCLVN